MTAPLRAAVYLRISLDRGGEGLAVERQREDCLKLCASRGWEPIEYVDNSISASNSKKSRPQYQKMLADIEAGTVQAVVAYRLDRLHRQPAELETFISLADRKNTALATVTGEVDLSTDTGRLMARIMGAVARQEVESKSARQKRAHIQRAAMGKPWATRRPFGFLDGGMEHHPEEAEIVRGIYRDILQGMSQRSITARLNREGVLTTLGNPWRSTSLQQLIVNPRNAGIRAHLGEIVGPGMWEPIVPEDTWRAAVYMATDHHRPGERGSSHLLSGVPTCGICGTGLTTGYTSRKVRMYRCPGCHRIGRNADNLDEYITHAVVTRLSRPDAQALLIDNQQPDNALLQETARTLRIRLDQIAEAYADNQINMKEWLAASNRVKQNLADTEAQIMQSTSAAILKPVIGAPDAAEAWASQPLERQRAIVRTLLNITVQPTRKGSKFRAEDITLDWRV